jgi:glutathione S-transferase
MMRLFSAPASPFVRKVTLTARIKGVMNQIQTEHADTRTANPTLAAANPLSKIPALVLADGTCLYDSRVICEYLDTLAPTPQLFPASGIDRYKILTRAALADGIMDAAILMVYEHRFRPAEIWSTAWVARQQSKIDAGLAAFEAQLPSARNAVDYADITLAAALGYLDLRFEGSWRADHPALVAWLEQFAADVPAYGETLPVG